MNHKLITICCVLLVCTLVGCATATPAPTATPTMPHPTNTPILIIDDFRPRVGIVLPTNDEPRWLQVEASFKDALPEADYAVGILFSQGDSAKEKANVETLISFGFQVLIICPVDATTAAAAVQEARDAGLGVISFDRLIRDTEAVDYFVTFDNVEIGEKQGRYLVDNATGRGNPLYLYAGPTSDEYSLLFFEGAWNVLQPRIADSTFVIKNSSEAVALQDKPELTHEEMARIIDQISTDWDPNTAMNLTKANLSAVTAADKGVAYILGPNDRTARPIADTFTADRDVTKYFITGQDAEKESIQYIIDGKQSMTVLKDVRLLVDDAVKAAIAFLEGGKPAATTTYNNGKIDVPANPPEVVTVTSDNVQQAIFDSGYYPARDFKP
jgi:putative multiple sugar transport system substrate-binding protein